MQDGTPQSPQASSPQATPTQAEVQPATADPTSGMSTDERSAYWKNVAVQNRQAANQFKQYEVLIDHLNKNPQHIDDFEKIITGQATLIATANEMAQSYGNEPQGMSDEDRLAEELGFPPEPRAVQAKNTPKSKATQSTDVEEAKRLGAIEERMRHEMALFKEDMLQNGIGEHLLDEFEQFLQDPSGMAFYDWFAAWRSKKARNTGVDPLTNEKLDTRPDPKGEGQGRGAMPSSVTGMTAAQSNRPDSKSYPAQGSGDRHVYDPANI